jgi:HTH-type transcriptional regulator/antitoxin HigA
MKHSENKIEVFNPIMFFNTIGQELEEIFLSNDIPMNILYDKMQVDEAGLKLIKKLTKRQLKQIQEITSIQGISEYLVNFQEEFSKSCLKTNSSFKENLKVFKKVKHLIPLLREEFNDGMDLLEDIAEFLNIENESEIFDRVNENIALYRISNFEPDSLNLYAWLRRGELDFQKLNLPEYSKSSFFQWIESEEWSKHLNDTSYLQNLPSILKSFGVGLVFTPYLNKTVFGAVRWFDGKPLIQISDKGKCLATVWYTLFHEFGHVIKHENDEIFEGNLDLPKSEINKKEKEANAFAYHYLFGGDGLRKIVFSYKLKDVHPEFLNELSERFVVDKMFVAYWMTKARIRCTSIYANRPKVSFT